MTKVAGFVLAVALLPTLVFAKGTTQSTAASHHKTTHHKSHAKAKTVKVAHKKAPLHTARIKKVSHTKTRAVHATKVSSAESNFQKNYPCPSNNNASGSCPGYVIDHVKPVDQGGDNSLENMQWRPVEAETPHA